MAFLKFLTDISIMITTTMRAKEILNYHVETHKGVKLVKVTTTRWYEIPEGTSTPDSEILTEWFANTSISRRHAFRDSSLLLEYFNNDAKISSPDAVTETCPQCNWETNNGRCHTGI